MEGLALLKVDKKGLRYYISGAFKVAGAYARSPLKGLQSHFGRRRRATNCGHATLKFPSVDGTHARLKNLGER
jgi:hypothetical protein